MRTGDKSRTDRLTDGIKILTCDVRIALPEDYTEPLSNLVTITTLECQEMTEG